MKPRLTYALVGLCVMAGTGFAFPPLYAAVKEKARTLNVSRSTSVAQVASDPSSENVARPHKLENQNPHFNASGTGTHTLPPSAVLDVPAEKQLPELPNGCEVTSLSMLLTAVGHPVDKMTLAKEQPRDPTPVVYGPDQTISSWGNPNKGFVGKVDGYPGYGIYHGPIVTLINKILPGRAVDLTGHPFSEVLAMVANQTPVMVWTTADFQPTSNWVTWNSPDGPVRATFSEHAVLLVGYNRTQLFVNDPLDGAKSKPVDRQSFIAAWKQLGQQAVTIQRK
jgi:uncharacterized protein YvpB